MRRLISVLLVLMMSVCMTLPVCAMEERDAANEEVSVNYVSINTISSSLSFSNGFAKCSTNVVGKAGTTKIKITMHLQKKTDGAWHDVETFSGSKNARSYTLTGSKAVSKGTYRIKSTVKVLI